MADIREKIQKLLSLATSPNENEARAALLKARELMAKNKLDEADFVDKTLEMKTIELEDIKFTTDSGQVWLADLCKLICDNYLCVAAWTHTKGHRTYILRITGMEDDLEICKEVVTYAVGFVRGQIKILSRKSRKDEKTVGNSYARGFLLGLELAFDAQKEEHPEWGLVVVKPKEVEDYADSLGERQVKTKKTAFDPLAYLKGQNDGQNFNAQRVLGEQAV